MNRMIIGATALVAVLGGGVVWNSMQPAGNMTSLDAASAQDAGEVDTSIVKEMSIGNPDASVTVIEYASFTCPHCAHFHETVYSDLKKNYIDTDKINFVYREVYFDPLGLWAGLTARCGDGEKYFGIADMIFDQQREWIDTKDPNASAQNLRRIGKTAGLTDDQLDACFADADMAKAMVAVYQENRKADNVQGTPTFIINGETYSNMNYADFAAILDEKLAE